MFTTNNAIGCECDATVLDSEKKQREKSAQVRSRWENSSEQVYLPRDRSNLQRREFRLRHHYVIAGFFRSAIRLH